MNIPDWLLNTTFSVQHSPNCPSPFMVRLIGRGAGVLDMRNHVGSGGTRDILGFGKTLEEAAEQARQLQNPNKKATQSRN